MEKVGSYEYSKNSFIGHGAFAIVFKGRHQKNHDNVVAIKVVSKVKLGKSQPLIGKEIKILQELTKLQHKNVVALLECVDSPKNLYIVIEYCNGGDLAEYLNNKGSLSEDTIRLFLKQIAEAMKVLNQKEVVHRDLKPQNILLCHQSQLKDPLPSEYTLKIADFGFARFLAEGNMAATLCGSPMYMAPEVIMSLKYDAKADLWSIGTIVYQCLTGKAPFMAPNPQQLKHFYEKNANLAPSIPSGTSEDLTDLLLKLMKRDAKDRIDVDELCNHPFIKPKPSSPVPVPTSHRSGGVASPPFRSPQAAWRLEEEEEEVGGEGMAQGSIGSPQAATGLLLLEQRYSPESPVERDFVVVPSNFSEENKFDDCEVNKNNQLKHQLSDPSLSPSKIPVSNKAFKKSAHQTNINLAARAVHYECMQISDPVPVPSQEKVYQQIEESLQQNSSGTSSPNRPSSPKESSPEPTSDRERRNSANSTGSSDAFRLADISSFTPPPSVQFTIGTPPAGGRLRSYSGSTPPLPGSGRQTPTGWRHQATPPQTTNYSTSPIRRSGSPGSHVALRRGCEPYYSRTVDHGAYRCLDFRNNPHPANYGVGRAMTLPEFNTRDMWPSGPMVDAEGLNFLQRSGSSGRLSDNGLPMGGHFAISGGGASPLMGGFNRLLYQSPHAYRACRCDSSPPFPLYSHSPSSLEGLFIPELPEETLLEKEHNETLAKLNFVHALVKCVIEIAKTKSSPLSSALSTSLTSESDSSESMSEGCRRAVQLLLYMRALHLIASAFNLSQQQIGSGQLQKSASVRTVLHSLNQQYHLCLSMCKSLNTPGLLRSVGVDPSASNLTADKILYKHAIHMCQSAATLELFGDAQESYKQYEVAQILLHSLGQQVNDLGDRELLHKYRDAVSKRLHILGNSPRGPFAYHNNP